MPAYERIITVEDAPEIVVSQPNAVGLVAVKGDLGEAKFTVEDLLQASLRLRPDRIIVGEIRGRETATFLRAINTGHPGSFTTVHANTPEGALEQIALMVMQSGLTLSRGETIAYARSLIDIVVQLGRIGGQRGIIDIRTHAAEVDAVGARAPKKAAALFGLGLAGNARRGHVRFPTTPDASINNRAWSCKSDILDFGLVLMRR